jgi:hypothetical protein
MKTLSFLFLYCIIFLQSPAQITFLKCYTGISNATPTVFQNADDGFTLLGRKIVRTNAAGDTLWSKDYSFGSSNATQGVLTSDGGAALCGYTYINGSSTMDCFISRTDSAGNVLWSKTYGGFHNDQAFSIDEMNDGGFIMAGQTRSANGGSSLQSYLVRTDSIGNIVWTKAFGAAGDNKSTTVKETSDGGIVVSGYCGILNIIGYNNVAFVTKLDGNGSILWSRYYDGPGTEVVNAIHENPDGSFVLTGTTAYFDSINVISMFMLTIDQSGLLQSLRYYANGFTFGYAVDHTSDGGFIIAGNRNGPSSDGDICLIKTDQSGDTIWTRAYGGTGNESVSSIRQTNDGGYIVCGSSDGFGYGYVLIKTDSLGNSGCYESPTGISVITDTMRESSLQMNEDTTGIAIPFTAVVSNNTNIVTACIQLAINELEESSFTLFPNPSDGRFTISFDQPVTEGRLNILNTLGEIIISIQLLNQLTIEINSKNLNPGIYFAEAIEKNRKCVVRIVVM